MIWKCKLGPLVCFTPIIKPRFLSFFEKKQTHEFGFQEPVNFLADSNLQKNDIRAGYVWRGQRERYGEGFVNTNKLAPITKYFLQDAKAI